MTGIAGIALPDGGVWMGGDSAGTNSSSQQTIHADAKVFLVHNGSGDEFLIGCTTSFRMIDLLKYKLEPPQYDGGNIHRYMVVEFVEAVRRCLKDGGFSKKESEREEGGDFLVGFRGRLFEVAHDYHVSEAQCEYNAIGSGDDLALGVLFATRDQDDPEARLKLALQAAAHHNCDVREPFVLLHLLPVAVSSLPIEPMKQPESVL